MSDEKNGKRETDDLDSYIQERSQREPGLVQEVETATQKRRLQLDLTSEFYSKLERMKGESGLASNAEVVRQALRYYEWYLSKKKKKQDILVRDQDGEIREVEFLD